MPDTGVLAPEDRRTGLIGAASTPGESVTTYAPSTTQASTAVARGYNAQGVTVGGDDTVQGQLNKITASDSPLMKQAERRARDEVAPRGLLNSSLAIGHAQEAVIGQALPIAQQDAQTFFNAKTKTVDANNAALNFGANADNQASLANAQLNTDVNKFNAGAKNDAAARAAADANAAALARLDASTRKDIANLDAATRTSIANQDTQTRLSLGQLDAQTRMSTAQLDSQTRLQTAQLDANTRMQVTQIENENRSLLQANQNAANMMNSASNAITNISIQTNLSQAAKDAAIQTQMSLLREGLRATGDVANLDLSQYFAPPSVDDSRRGQLQAAADQAKSEIPVWGENYASYQASPGSRQSERTADNFNRLLQEKTQAYYQALDALNSFSG